MKKTLLLTIGLLVAFSAVGCKSRNEKVYEQQIEAIRRIFVANGLNAEEELRYGIARDLHTKQISNLDLSGRNLTVLPPEIGLLTGLEELDLRNNKLTGLPEEIGNLKRLKRLNAAINKLVMLPESIGNLESLEELDVSENKLTELPETIGKLANLSQFWLFKNELAALPEPMVNLVKITHIAPTDNPFKVFPIVLGAMPNLSSIMISEGFDTTTIPPNVKHETGSTYVVTH